MKKTPKDYGVLSIRLSDEERALLDQAALRAGRKVGAYIRHCALLNALWQIEEDGTGMKLSKELNALKRNNEPFFEAVRDYVKARMKKAS